MKIIKFNSPQAIAKDFASYLTKNLANEKLKNIAISGGSTPKILFEVLAQENEIDWNLVSIYWVDERCVPPTDNESNYKMTKEYLFDKIAIPKENINRILGENDPKEEVSRYAELIKKKVPNSNEFPIFDLVLLGMGGDGHTASIFPYQIELLNNNLICALATHPETGQKRITLTGNSIQAAKEIHFLVTGESKAKVIKEIFLKEKGYEKYPASHFPDAHWWIDEAANKLINK